MFKFKSLIAKLIFMGIIMLTFLAIYITADYRFTHHVKDEAKRISIVSRERMLIHRMALKTRAVIIEASLSVEKEVLEKGIKKLMAEYEEGLYGLRDGSERLGLKPIPEHYQESISHLNALIELWQNIQKPVLFEVLRLPPERKNETCRMCHSAIRDNIGKIEVFVSSIERHHEKEIKDFDTLRLYVLGFFFIATVFIICYAIQSIIKPVKRLRDATKEIEKGNFDVRVDVKSKDEIGESSSAFNQMTQTLKILFDEKTRHLREVWALTDASNIIFAISPTANIYEAICNIAVRNFDLRMVWIGLIEEGSYDIKIVAHAGFEEGYLSTIKVTWDDSPTGMGPSGMAIKTKTSRVIHDYESDPAITPWRQESLKRGYRSSMAVPIIFSDGKVIGVLRFYSGEPQFFTGKMFDIFQVFANQAATAIENRWLIEGLEEKVHERTKELEMSNLELKKLTNAVEQAAESVVITDTRGTIQYVNPAFSAISSYSKEEALGNNPRILNSGKNPPGLFKGMWETILSGRVWKGTVINKKKTGELYYEEMTVTPVMDNQGKITNFIAIKKDVTERVRAEEELQAAMKQAESASRAKSEFLALMSHEVRTPLNSIIGFSDMLAEGIEGPLTEKQKEHINSIHKSGEHLLSLINDILDLSKIEAGKMDLELNKFLLRDLLNSSLLFFREKARSHNIEISLKMEDEGIIIEADIRRLRQVMLNLLSNAIKFTPDGGSVRVTARKVRNMNVIARSVSGPEQSEGTRNEIATPSARNDSLRDFIEISVEDTGIGISKEDQAKLFQPFQQIESDIVRKVGGIGLGLAISKKFVELHGGRIWVESEVGKGSRFVFVIPVRQ
ncbi:MAG: ATP-binding protein [Nitrospirota bacterium]